MRYKDIIDFTMAAEDGVSVEAALTTLEEKLPFLIGLNKTEIRRMSSIGQRNETFVNAAIEAGKNNPNLIPPGLSLAAVERDRIGREKLAQYSQRVQILNEKLIHTRRALGADLYAAARAIYKSLQEFGKDAGIGDLLEDLGRRFKPRNRRNGDGEPSTPTTGGTNA